MLSVLLLILSLQWYSLTLCQNIQAYIQKDLIKSMQWPEILLPGGRRGRGEEKEKYIKWLIKKDACALPSRGYSFLNRTIWGAPPNRRFLEGKKINKPWGQCKGCALQLQQPLRRSRLYCLGLFFELSESPRRKNWLQRHTSAIAKRDRLCQARYFLELIF